MLGAWGPTARGRRAATFRDGRCVALE
jgi:hypothetical protein